MGRTKGDGIGKTGGRVKGTPNKITQEAQAVLAAIVNNNSYKVQDMLDVLAEEDPEAWLRMYAKLSEFVIAKKAAVSISPEDKKSDFTSELEALTKKEI